MKTEPLLLVNFRKGLEALEAFKDATSIEFQQEVFLDHAVTRVGE